MNIETNVVIWQNSGPSGALSVHVLNVDGTNTFTYNATSSEIFVQIRQAGTYYLDNIRMYRTYEDTIFVRGYEVDMAYRYGFNSMERDNEIKGLGNHISWGDYGYDPRIVRRWQPDPLQAKYPWQSPYSVLGNNPILHKEIDGRDYEVVVDKSENGNTITIKATYYTDVKDSDSRKNTDTGSHEIGHTLNLGHFNFGIMQEIDKEGIITRDSEVTRNNIQFMLNAVFSGLCTTCRVSPGKDNKANTITTNPQGNKVEGGIVSEKD